MYLCAIEHAMTSRYQNRWKPLTVLIGMSAILGCNTKMHYVLNHICVTPSCHSIERLRVRLISNVRNQPMGTLGYLKRHELAVLSIDNLDRMNKHGLPISGRNDHRLHITAIQGVLCNFDSPMADVLRANGTEVYKQKSLWDAKNLNLLTDLQLQQMMST